jgi:uncharacterized membrane protein
MMTAAHFHALIIHFPIALLMAGFLSDLISLFNQRQFFKSASFFLLVLGTLGAIVAFISGGYAGDGMTDGVLQEPIEMHEDSALITLWLAIITTLSRAAIFYFNYLKAWARWTSFLLFAVLTGFVARTGYLGGELVFKHGAGIELSLPDFKNEADD